MSGVVDINERLKFIKQYCTTQQTLFQRYVHFMYYIMTMYIPYLQFMFYKSFSIKMCILKYNEDIRLLKIKNNNQFFITDSGISILGFFIPYEHIIRFSYYSDKIIMDIFASYNVKTDKSIFLQLQHTFVKDTFVRMTFKTENKCVSKKIFDLLKTNLHYHLKYNKINTEHLPFILN